MGEVILILLILLPKLAEFADALSSVTPRKDGYISILLQNMQLGDVVGVKDTPAIIQDGTCKKNGFVEYWPRNESCNQ
jgi:hypothetical protein